MASSLVLDHSGRPYAIPDEPQSTHPSAIRYRPDERKKIIDGLCAPFPFEELGWRVVNNTKDKKRGLVAPFLRTNFVIDRLNTTLGHGNWSSRPDSSSIRLDIATKDGEVRSKTVMTCTLSIPGIGIQASSGEHWANEDNSVTSCEAQALKRAAMKFGIGSYLARVPKFWADLDGNKSIVDTPAFRQDAATALAIALGPKPAVAPQKAPTGNGTEALRKPVQNSQQDAALLERQRAAFRAKLDAKKSEATSYLGAALYADVAARAKATVDPKLGTEARAGLITQQIDAACDLLKEVRRVDESLPTEAALRVLDQNKVQNLAAVPDFLALLRIARAFAPLARRQGLRTHLEV